MERKGKKSGPPERSIYYYANVTEQAGAFCSLWLPFYHIVDACDWITRRTQLGSYCKNFKNNYSKKGQNHKSHTGIKMNTC